MISERITCVAPAAPYVQRFDHAATTLGVRCSACSASSAGARLVRRVIVQHERHALAGLDVELGDRRQVLAVQSRTGVRSSQRVGPGGREQPPSCRRTHGTIVP